MGLLDGTFDPRMQGLLAAGAAGLQASGPSRTPVSLGQVMGAGLMGGMNQYNEAQGMKLKAGLLDAQTRHMGTQDRLLEAQVAAAERKARLEEEQRRMMVNWAGGVVGGPGPSASQAALSMGAETGDVGPTNTNAQRMGAVQPSSLYHRLTPESMLPMAAGGMNIEPLLKLREAAKPNIQVSDGFAYDPTRQLPGFLPKPRTADLGGEEVRYLTNPDGTEREVSRTPKTAAPSSRPIWLNADNSINRTLFDAQLGLTKAGATRVDAGVRMEGEFSKKLGQQYGEMYADMMRSDFNAPSNIAKYQRLGSLLSQVNTGKFVGTTTDLKAAAKGLGFDLTAMGVADNVAPAQASRMLSNQLALELRNPAGGAGMPGAMSDSDRQFLVQMVPNLENDPGAVPTMIEYRTKLAQRDREVARLARQFRQKNNGFNDGFFEELAQWSEKNPLFQQQAPKPKPAADLLQQADDIVSGRRR